MLDCHLEDYRCTPTYNIPIEDYIVYHRKELEFQAFVDQYELFKEEDLYTAIIDNVLHNSLLRQRRRWCITRQDEAELLQASAAMEDVVLDDFAVQELIDALHCCDVDQTYSWVRRFGEERFIERYKRETGRDYVELDYAVPYYSL